MERGEKVKKQRGKGREKEREEKRRRTRKVKRQDWHSRDRYTYIDLSNRSLPNRSISRICKLYKEKTKTATVRCPVVIPYREKG